MANNRTIKFYGQGYGSSPASIDVIFNGATIFSGTVPTIEGTVNPQPTLTPGMAVVLFELDNSSIVATDFGGAIPMTVTVTGGNGVILARAESNYSIVENPIFTTEELAVLTAVPTNRTAAYNIRAAKATPAFSAEDAAFLQTFDTSDATQTLEAHTLYASYGVWTYVATADTYGYCFNGTPTNSEGTPDIRSSVKIDGVTQVPPLEQSAGCWNWAVVNGGVLECNFNISAAGNPITDKPTLSPDTL